jgi:HSP20 family protein
MTTIRWQPMRGMDTVQNEMNQLFNSMFGSGSSRESRCEGCWQPEVDIIEDKDNFAVKLDIPGLEKEDIKVSVHENVLKVSGERKAEKEVEGKNYHRIERSSGAFSRSFSLPTAVDGQKIKANYKNGVLAIELPKVEEQKPKEIPISVA